jgi:hypothetical protein
VVDASRCLCRAVRARACLLRTVAAFMPSRRAVSAKVKPSQQTRRMISPSGSRRPAMAALRSSKSSYEAPTVVVARTSCANRSPSCRLRLAERRC